MPLQSLTQTQKNLYKPLTQCFILKTQSTENKQDTDLQTFNFNFLYLSTLFHIKKSLLNSDSKKDLILRST